MKINVVVKILSVLCLAETQRIFKNEDKCSSTESLSIVRVLKIQHEQDMKKVENMLAELQGNYAKMNISLKELDTRTRIPVNAQTCPSEWIKNGTSCYRFVKQLYTWADAKVYCEALQSQMVKIDTSLENNFLKQQLQAIFNYPSSDNEQYQHWIGCSDEEKEGTWRWTSGSEITFTDWGHASCCSPEPSDGKGSNCATMFKALNYQWNDAPCSYKFSFICEKLI